MFFRKYILNRVQFDYNKCNSILPSVRPFDDMSYAVYLQVVNYWCSKPAPE